MNTTTTIQQLKKTLLPLSRAERAFAGVYRRYPDLSRRIYESYEDFAGQALALDPNIVLPPMHYMGPELTEEAYFADSAFVTHADPHPRFVPPYRERVGFIKIIYMFAGGGTFFYANARQTLAEGDFVIVPPGLEHSLWCCDRKGLAINLLLRQSTFAGEMGSLLSERNALSAFFWQILYARRPTGIVLCRAGRDVELCDLVAKIYMSGRDADMPEVNNLIVKSYDLLFFGIVMKRYTGAIAILPSQQGVRSEFSSIIRYIHDNCKSVTLPETAAHFSLSEGYLSRYIHAETGKTFRQLVRFFKIEWAAELLRASDCTVEEAAEAVGYLDASRFHRNFKEHFGMTPAAYRRCKNISL